MNQRQHIRALRVSLLPRLCDLPRVHHRDRLKLPYCAPMRVIALHPSLRKMPLGEVRYRDLALPNSSWRDRCNFQRPYRLHRRCSAPTASPALEPRREDRVQPIGAAAPRLQSLPRPYGHEREREQDRPVIYRCQCPPAPSSGGDRSGR